MTTQILNYGGGRQTVAICILIAEGKYERPDHIVIADTGREKPSTWDYLEEVMQPYLERAGLKVEIAPRSLAYVDLYSHQGELLLPVYTQTGKLSAFCSTEWKQRVVRRYLKSQDVHGGMNWIGYAIDERKRYNPTKEDKRGPWYRRFPLFDLNLTKTDCRALIDRAGLPLPPPSSCWMCPNMPNAEWRYIRDEYPAAFEQACQLDEEIREEDMFRGQSGVWLHHSRVPLRQADLDADDGREESRQCGLGMCFI